MRNERSVRKLSGSLRRRYGSALDRVVVFGSTARGTAREGSDIDVLVVLDVPQEQADWRVEREIRALALAVELEDDVVFDLKVVAQEGLSGLRGHTPFMERVLAEGVVM